MSNTILPKVLSDVSIIDAHVPTYLNAVSASGALWQISQERFLLNVPSVARYLVGGGKTITIDRATDVSAKVEYHLGLLPLAALLYQRGMLAFHAAAASNGKEVVMLAGDSASGKSTLLAAFVQRGWHVFADDLTIVDLNQQGTPIVHPTVPAKIMLWPDSIKELTLGPDTLPCADNIRREFMPSSQNVAETLPLLGIFRINVHSKGVIEIEDVAGSDRFRAAGSFLYNSHVAASLSNRLDYLRYVAAIAQAVPIRIIRRPWGVWCIDTLVESILQFVG